MTDISAKGVVKAFEEGNNILDGLSFDITEGEHVGILGKNGAGKTTLFRLLTGELETDEGSIAIASGKRLGLISQIPVFPAHYTTEDVLMSAHERLYRMRGRMQELEAEMASGSPSREIMREYDALTDKFVSAGGYDMDTERNKIANGLDIPASMRAQLFSTLSGGEKTRVNLARLILEDTDILLLDEPTNHLDLRAVEWLEGYLGHFSGTVLAISHDRYFLDNAVTRIIEIVDGKAELYSGNYSFYVQEKQRRFDEKLKAYEKSRKQIDRLQKAADDLHLWAFMGNDKLHKRAFSMEKRLARLRQTEKPVTERAIKARFGEKEFRGDEVFTVKDLGKSYDGRTLFSDVTLEVRAGERIALIGDNGAGKSTFIKTLLGEERADCGHIRFGPSVKKAYLPQVVSFKNPYYTVLDTLVAGENMPVQAARDRLGAFKFSGEDVFKTVNDLSGGEKSRLRLCALMKDDINLLILDEPTNHLDIASREWIEQALEDYGEALLFVSHDRFFIERFATRIWEIRDGKITDFRGGYEKYRSALALAAASGQSVQGKGEKQPKEDKTRRKPGAKNVQRLREAAEKERERLEERLRELEEQTERSASDYEKLQEIFAEREETEKALDAAYEKWAETE